MLLLRNINAKNEEHHMSQEQEKKYLWCEHLNALAKDMKRIVESAAMRVTEKESEPSETLED